MTLSAHPSSSLFALLGRELARMPPFAQMAPADVRYFIEHASEHYFAPGELLLQPQDGAVTHLMYLRQGFVTGAQNRAAQAQTDLAENRAQQRASAGAVHLETGDLFPVSAALAQRAVFNTYQATSDVFVLKLPLANMLALAERSAPFDAFLRKRAQHMLALSREALATQYSAQALAEQSLESGLGSLIRRPPVSCLSQSSLREALLRMSQAKISSIMVVDEQDHVVGILTERDVLNKVALPQLPLDQPIAAVMQQPVYCLTVDDTAQQAAMLMLRHSIRHVPITRDGKLAGVVSERDLFALQRLSMRGISDSITQAADLDTLKHLASQIRRFAGSLLAQGVHAKQACSLISHLNDLLTERIITNTAQKERISTNDFCWLALGSEGRSEQTIATDQDNALLLADACDDAARTRLLEFAHKVTYALDACGYPLCKGNIMASNPFWCRTQQQWLDTVLGWIASGSPEDVLHSHMFFDMRPLGGNAAMCEGLRADLLEKARANQRFIKQLAETAFNTHAAINWMGGIDSKAVDGRQMVDLKQQGTALFVVVARVYALAHGVSETGTAARLSRVGEALGLQPAEYNAWIGAFEFLQQLRLQVQLELPNRPAGPPDNPNGLYIDDLNQLDRKILKGALRAGASLQQRLQLDYGR
jgi:CBS domain-containing protein